MPSLTATVDIWQHHARTACSGTVVPDGCCDLIWHALPGQCPEWFVTDLATQRYNVPGTMGESYFGFRLQPGTCSNSIQLLAALSDRPGYDANDILLILHDCAHLDAAATWGYSDQAHMTREFKRWLGTTPAALRTQPDIHEALQAAGYG